MPQVNHIIQGSFYATLGVVKRMVSRYFISARWGAYARLFHLIRDVRRFKFPSAQAYRQVPVTLPRYGDAARRIAPKAPAHAG